MNYEDLQKAWQNQGNPSRVNIDTRALLREVQRNKSDFDSMVFWRDMREVGVAFIMTGVFLYWGIWDGLWPVVLMAVGTLWIAVFMLVDRRRHRRRPPASADPLRSCIEASVQEVDHQIWLLTNVLWWYLLPPGIAGLPFIGYLAWTARSSDVLWLKLFVTGLCVVSGSLSLGVYHLNQWAVAKHLQPRRKELQDLLVSLGSSDGGEPSKESLAPAAGRSIMTQLHRVCLWALVAAPIVLAAICWTGGESSASSATQPAKVPHPSAVLSSMIQPAKELRIVRARYGAKESWVDVAEQLNQDIHDNKLVIQASNDIAGDPIFNTFKRLEVEYVLNGAPGKARVDEHDYLYLPPVLWTRQRLLDFVAQCPARVSLYGQNFTAGATIEHNADRPVCLASIVKIFDLLEVARQVDQGKIHLEDTIRIPRKDGDTTCSIDRALDLMIGRSDNEATNALARLVGYDNVNALPGQLKIEGLSDQIMPRPGVLERVLDQRVAAGPASQPSLLPQHGTMRGLVRYFELLHKNELLAPEIGEAVLRVFDRNPMPYVDCFPAPASVVGKGGSLVWIRPPKMPYHMGGWVVYVRNSQQAMGLAIVCEWWPDGTPEDLQYAWCRAMSNGAAMLLHESAGGAASRGQ